MADKIAAKDPAGRKKDFVLIDLREADEVETDGKIEGATNLPLGYAAWKDQNKNKK
jgi:rhodanese-related sulfurtransferase